MEIELEEFVFIQEGYEAQLDKAQTLNMFPPRKEDYVRHILHSFDLADVNSCSQVIGLDHEQVDEDYTTVHFYAGLSIIVKIQYKDFKKLLKDFRESEKRKQFNK